MDTETEIHNALGLMNQDKPLSPKLISSLLNVGVNLSNTHMFEMDDQKSIGTSVLYSVTIVALSVALATLVGTIFLYTYEVGPFYEGVGVSLQ